jgi:hypothetical protein
MRFILKRFKWYRRAVMNAAFYYANCRWGGREAAKKSKNYEFVLRAHCHYKPENLHVCDIGQRWYFMGWHEQRPNSMGHHLYGSELREVK